MVNIPKKKSLPVDIDPSNPESHQEYIRSVDEDLTLLFDREVINQEAIEGKEDYLGVPASDGDVLSSLVDGTRSWITPSGGGGGFTNMQVFTSNGTWTKPDGITRIMVELWGGGGGGGGGGTSSNSGPGASGAYGMGIYDVDDDVTVVVGAGGAGGATGGTGSTGGNGSPSSVSGGSLPADISVAGGGGGTPSAEGVPGLPGAGCTLGIEGSRGEFQNSASRTLMGPGAARGGGQGFNGRFPGGGGAGAPQDIDGGPGGNGAVIIYW